MKTSQREWGTIEALGIASIIETATGAAYHVEQDLKGRWHVWSVEARGLEDYDTIARQLEPDAA